MKATTILFIALFAVAMLGPRPIMDSVWTAAAVVIAWVWGWAACYEAGR